MEVILTEDQLCKICREWQEILSLKDWRIAIAKAHEYQFKNPGNEGECEWQIKKKMAIIRILHENDSPKGPFQQDMEETLVHELLHLHYAPFDYTKDGTPEEIALEQSIHFVSRALIELKRGNGHVHSRDNSCTCGKQGDTGEKPAPFVWQATDTLDDRGGR